MKFLKRILAVAFIATFTFSLSGCSQLVDAYKDAAEEKYEEQYTRSRTASENDLSNVQFSTEARSASIKFVPDTDIEGLKLKIELYDKDEVLLESKIVSVGNVTDGQQEIVTVNLSDNAFTEGKTIKKVILYVESGTIYYSVAPGLYNTNK